MKKSSTDIQTLLQKYCPNVGSFTVLDDFSTSQHEMQPINTENVNTDLNAIEDIATNSKFGMVSDYLYDTEKYWM